MKIITIFIGGSKEGFIEFELSNDEYNKFISWMQKSSASDVYRLEKDSFVYFIPKGSIFYVKVYNV